MAIDDVTGHLGGEGALRATIRRRSRRRRRVPGGRPVRPACPIGADRWDDLVRQLAAADAPTATGLAARRDELVALEGLLEHRPISRRAIATCSRTTSCARLQARCASAIGRTAGWPTPRKSWGSCCSSTAAVGLTEPAICTGRIAAPAVLGSSNAPATSRWSSPRSPTSARSPAADGWIRRVSPSGTATPSHRRVRDGDDHPADDR